MGAKIIEKWQIEPYLPPTCFDSFPPYPYDPQRSCFPQSNPSPQEAWQIAGLLLLFLHILIAVRKSSSRTQNQTHHNSQILSKISRHVCDICLIRKNETKAIGKLEDKTCDSGKFLPVRPANPLHRNNSCSDNFFAYNTNFGRYCSASAKCTDWISSLPDKSAIVRASFKMR